MFGSTEKLFFKMIFFKIYKTNFFLILFLYKHIKKLLKKNDTGIKANTILIKINSIFPFFFREHSLI